MSKRIAIPLTLIPLAGLLLAAPGFADGRRGDLLASADANQDGVVTKQEFLDARAAQFGRFDRNADGYIDDADVPERMRERRDARGGGAMRKELDKDGDGKVSKEEFVTGPTTIFDRVDADHNGSLDKQELEAAKAAARERAEQRRQP
jgi:Ca2+-binding EF-hand superfamily protein